MIRRCIETDFDSIFSIINDAAMAYKGVIPPDRWHEPYMPEEELKHEIDNGVQFWGYSSQEALIGVMGYQPVLDVTLIRHAYVRTARRGQGVGGRLLSHILQQIEGPVLIGTWASASWAVRFYEKYGFRLVSREETDRLLQKYWRIPARQIETSVVLGNEFWLKKTAIP